MRTTLIMTALLAALLFCACRQEPAEPASRPAAPPTETAATPERTPPAPPLYEDFESDPQLSLFPRAGDFRPEDDDQEKLPFWRTFIDHLTRTSGVLVSNDEPPRHVFALRSINTIDSVGFFSPVAVAPDTAYRVRCAIRTELPEGASAGIGILEFDEFLWIAEQFPESLQQRHQTGIVPGASFTGTSGWQQAEFKFVSGPQTRMIHLVLYRDGTHDRTPVLFDDIGIEPVKAED